MGYTYPAYPDKFTTSPEDDPMRRADGDVSAVGRIGAILRRAAVAMALGLAAMTPALTASAGGPPDDPPGGGPAPSGGRSVPDAGTGVSKDAAHACYLRGVTALDKGDNDAAIAQFTEAIRLDPRLAAAYADRARAHGRKNELEKTIGDCNKAIRLEPDMSSAYACRGRRLVKNGTISTELWPI